MGLSGFIDRMTRQTLTYWAKSSDDEYGDPSFASPVQISGRMEEKTELFIDNQGDEKHSKAFAWSATAMTVGGYLYLGTSATTNPESVDGADQIRRVEVVTDVKGRVTLYKAIL